MNRNQTTKVVRRALVGLAVGVGMLTGSSAPTSATSVADLGGFDAWALIDCPECFVDSARTYEAEIWGAIDLGFWG